MSSDDKALMSVSFIKRKAELTPADLFDHWVNVHRRLVRPCAEKHGFKGYTQTRFNRGQPIGPESKEASPLESLVGCALMEISSFEHFSAAFMD
ncbi:hypothetical protein F5Y16DRAFT_396302 [Xylariaceae sp. FL0255]|nr:hypothetical protein F5Y16DRAFT_396302 [Xylariaceae sp. FL0255]